MKKIFLALIFISIVCTQCKSVGDSELTLDEKQSIENLIQNEINTMIEAVNKKDIKTYMEKMPLDFIIYDENGEIITREKQRERALRDWSIIKKTLNNQMNIDSIDYTSRDSLYVYTSQRWERLMFQRDGITTDTVLTTQKHKELWKKGKLGWIGYDIEELGGNIFINGKKYKR
ncbi:hypothetical protein Q2T40_19430 [Winogradskyella maritima]|uniref:DUF4440 domain-containing protein n=1 Tax=Winogradskyella maritima TaxID=1517766 RepID=A0ABV8AGE4_9FLAO|nr:hypothetical protein [Winogradskyella maritima]